MSNISKKLFSAVKSPIGDLIVGIVFGKFSKVLPVKRIIETDKVISFWHPTPFYEEHILVVPKKSIKNILSIKESDEVYITEMYRAVRRLIKDLGWEKKGYTLLTNGGTRQEVGQLHFHLVSGKAL